MVYSPIFQIKLLKTNEKSGRLDDSVQILSS